MSTPIPRLIGLTGYAKSGKSTVAELLVKHEGFVHINFADTLRELALRIDPFVTREKYDPIRLEDIKGTYSEAIEKYGYNEAKEARPELRRFLQELGTGVRDLIDEDIWVDAWKTKVFAAIYQGKRVVSSDTRFLNEAEAVEGFGGTVWRIDRVNVGPQSSHQSETEVDKIHAEKWIVNDALDELPCKIALALGHHRNHYSKKEAAA